MQPRQEIWVGDGDSLKFEITDDWFVMSRGTLQLPIKLTTGQLAHLRQHGGESLWYSMMGEAGGLDELEGTRWTIEKAEDGSWHPPALEPTEEDD